MKIILFRHGEKQKSDSKDKNVRRSVCLTPKGINQIKTLGGRLMERFPELIGITNIFSSPYPRSIQSAEIVRGILDIKEIVPIQELQEFYPIDEYDQPKEYRQGLMNKALINSEWIGPNGKSLMNSLDNFENFLLKIPESNITLISSHGALIRNLAYRLSPELRPNNEEILTSTIIEGGYTLLERSNNVLKLCEFNQ